MALRKRTTRVSAARPAASLTVSAEQRVLRQLLEALMFEDLIPCRTHQPNGAGWHWLSFRIGDLRGRCYGRIRGFGRVRLDITTLSLEGHRTQGYRGLASITARLPGTTECRQKLLQELIATVNNTERLDALSRSPTPSDRRLRHGDALDCALHEGHPYHPCFKSRLGFRDDDLVRYSPETSKGFRLHWVAVPRSHLDAQLPTPEMTFWQTELDQEHAFLLRAAFHRAGLDWQQHGALPVHPWQWQQLRTGPMAASLSGLDIRSLGELGDRYRPAQSLRSLYNLSRPAQACIKLPLGIHNTSARRHLEPHSVPSAPVISRWLGAIVAADPHFARQYPLRLLPEYASLACTAGAGLAGELAAIWRASIGSQLQDHEQAIPLNALFQWQPDGLPFIHPWVDRYGLGPWLEATLRAVILPVWHMLAAHGAGLEAHAQNSLLVVRDGWPVALMLRDFHDSVEYTPDYLATGTPEPDFGPRQSLYDHAPDGQYYRMADPEALRELVMDTLFIYNLSELALLLGEAYGLDEASFWERVQMLLTGYQRQHPDLGSRLDRLGWSRPWLQTESLLAPKLQPNTGCSHHQVPNPLSCRPDTRPSPTTACHQESLS